MSMTVLVIDDQPLEGEMVAFVLKQNRPDTEYIGQALNASEGVRMAALHQPSLIFLDIKMPGMDGLTAISHLRQASPHTQVIMLTAFDDFDYLRGALRAGARDYLLKPVRPADILSALDSLEAEEAPLQTITPPVSVPRMDRLAEAVRAGDSTLAVEYAHEFLSRYLLLDQANLIYACVRCMEFASELTQAFQADQVADGLTFLYQDFVHQVSTLKEPDLLEGNFTEFVRKAADTYGHMAGDMGYRQIAEAKQYIAAHYHEPLQLSEVAKKLYLSTAYFSRLFKEKTGVTFSDYLANCRIDRARQLLATTDLSISEISAAIGYQEANSFSRLFKARTGQSPSDYRTSQLGK